MKVIYKCDKCHSTNVLHKFAMLIDPNDENWQKDFDATALDYDDFDYCIDCQDSTSTYEAEQK